MASKSTEYTSESVDVEIRKSKTRFDTRAAIPIIAILDLHHREFKAAGAHHFSTASHRHKLLRQSLYQSQRKTEALPASRSSRSALFDRSATLEEIRQWVL